MQVYCSALQHSNAQDCKENRMRRHHVERDRNMVKTVQTENMPVRTCVFFPSDAPCRSGEGPGTTKLLDTKLRLPSDCHEMNLPAADPSLKTLSPGLTTTACVIADLSACQNAAGQVLLPISPAGNPGWTGLLLRKH